MSLELWELWSYFVTVIGLPFAIGIFIYEQRKAHDNDAIEVFQLLSNSYDDFLRVALDHPDLRLFSASEPPDLTIEQREQMLIIFNMLVSLFERAYLLLYDDLMSTAEQRRWRSWEDYMREWCRKRDFRNALPALLSGEDPDFASYIQRVADEELAIISRNALASGHE